MQLKKMICTVLACIVTVSAVSTNVVGAVDLVEEKEMVVCRATGKFNMDVTGKTIVHTNTSFPLEVGETVTIKASYSPFSASVDFGVIAPDGLFYATNVTNGSVDWTIKVSQRGNYRLAIRNNSSVTINVSGYVNY